METVMAKLLTSVAALLACAFLVLAEEKLQPVVPAPAAQLYQIDLVPSGNLISQDPPILKGTSYLFHQYPTGTLISVRKSTVKQIAKMSPAAVAAANPTATKRIGNLAMQGPRVDGTQGAAGGGPRNMGRARAAVSAANAGTTSRTTSPE
jgi:hypothetical protein